MGKKNSKLKQDTIDRLTTATYCKFQITRKKKFKIHVLSLKNIFSPPFFVLHIFFVLCLIKIPLCFFSSPLKNLQNSFHDSHNLQQFIFMTKKFFLFTIQIPSGLLYVIHLVCVILLRLLSKEHLPDELNSW